MRLPRALRPLGPAVARPRPRELLRACIGAGVGLTVCTFLVRLTIAPFSGTGPDPALLLIAPLGATAMLAFAVPSSPLAQPWSAVVGNTVSALMGVAVVLTVGEPWLALGLSVTLAMIAMMLLRAIHPPAAGVALGAVLSAESVGNTGFLYAFNPVFVDTVLLLLVATAYNHATGRTYPFRQPEDHAPDPRGEVGLSPALQAPVLQGILETLKLDANIGAGDFARLIAAAHTQAAEHLFDGVAAAQVMSRDPVRLAPDTTLPEVAAEFRAHRVRALPVTLPDGSYLGLLSESDLLHHMQPQTDPADEGVLARLLRSGRGVSQPRASDVMDSVAVTVTEDAPLGTLIDCLAEGAQQSIPVLRDGMLAGIVTRSDLIAALSRAHHPAPPPALPKEKRHDDHPDRDAEQPGSARPLDAGGTGA